MTLFAIAIYGIFSVVGLSASIALYVDDVAVYYSFQSMVAI
jgi:hypothetical protein